MKKSLALCFLPCRMKNRPFDAYFSLLKFLCSNPTLIFRSPNTYTTQTVDEYEQKVKVY